MTTPYSQIGEIEALVRSLAPADRRLFHSLYDLRVEAALTRPLAGGEARLRRLFGSVEAVRTQRVVKIWNRVTLEGALFNPLRARLPQGRSPAAPPPSPGQEDPFADPASASPEDVFGRVRGRHATTTSNVAKADAFHAVVIFHDPVPLAFDRERVLDYLETAWRWVLAAHQHDPQAVYPFLLWNAGARAGASVAHGHMQALLGKGRHYTRVEALRRAALAYPSGGLAGYFRDLFAVHRALGLGFEEEGVRILAHLTPVKEREVLVLAPEVGPALFEGVYRALEAYRTYLGVQAFNLALFAPPLLPTGEEWEGFPAQARLLDRGSPANPTADFAALEIYGQPIVSSDPFEVARALSEG